MKKGDVLMKKASPRRKTRNGNFFTRHATPILLAPYALLFVIFIVIPTLSAIGLSFTYYNTIETPRFTGLDNFIDLFTNDEVFMQHVLPNTVIYAICVGIGGYLLSFLLAWALSQITKGPRTILALIIYSPSMTGGVLLSTVWSVIFNGSESGYLNYILLKLGVIETPVVWLSSETHLLWIVIVVTLWSSMGIGFLSMLSGILNVNAELSAGENTTYTYTLSTGKTWIKTQDAYLPGNIYQKDAGLSQPEDIFIRGGEIYTADTGNARILISSIQTGESREIKDDAMVNPCGLFVTDNGDIYVADRGAPAVFVFSASGERKLMIERPDSKLFSELSDYTPKNVVVTTNGNIYVCSENAYEGLMQFSPEGEFEGYFGANHKHLTAKEIFSDLLLSDNMKQNELMRRPRTIKNLDIAKIVKRPFAFG